MTESELYEKLREGIQGKLKEDCKKSLGTKLAGCNSDVDCKPKACWYWESKGIADYLISLNMGQAEEVELPAMAHNFPDREKRRHLYECYDACHEVERKSLCDAVGGTLYKVTFPKEVEMKYLQKQINLCYGCPYYRTPSDDKVKLDWCFFAGKLIENIHTENFPIWCPLPDKPLEVKHE